MLYPTALQVEYKTNPLGMDERRPRFFYQLKGDSLLQSARRIRVLSESGETMWDSGFQETPVTIQIEYEGKLLRPFTRCYYQVQVRDEQGQTSGWSQEKAFFETGFLGTPWTAKWIRAQSRPGPGNQLSATRFRRDFTLGKPLKRARLYATALGLYRAFINGKPVTENCFTPGWTDYFHRVQYQAYDLTGMLAAGKNTLAFLLNEGWYCGSITRHWHHGAATYGPTPLLLSELHLSFEDGSEEIIASGADWQVVQGDRFGFNTIRMSDIYMGETFQSKPEGDRWMLPETELDAKVLENAFEDRISRNVSVVWQSGASVRPIMDLPPRSISRHENGSWIVDFGQNLTGRERFRLAHIPAGTTILIRHGEMLTEAGTLYTENLRSAAAQTLYTCTCEKENQEYEPSFTFYGFRYLEITGWPGLLTGDQISARVIHSNLPETGSFQCSEPLLNQLYSNIVWGQRGNFLDIPSDCPQRDERLGWTADTQVFINTATFNLYAPEFYTKWLEDLHLQITPFGAFPLWAPDPYCYNGDGKEVQWRDYGATGWSDAGVICPWVMFEKYGDTRILRKFYDSICTWLDLQIARANGSLIVKNAALGDWLNIDAPIPEEYLSTAYLGGMNELAARMACILGKHSEAHYREELYRSVAQAFQKEFFTPDGEPMVKTQTAALLALHFDLLTEKAQKRTVEFLKHDIRDTHNLHLSTGFLGTPLLLKVLAKIGEIDLAYDLLLQTGYPGWLYPVTQGATTMWERWNSYTIEGGFGDSSMNSFNHYAYGAVGEWFFETICGIGQSVRQTGEGGFRNFRLAPQFGTRLSHARAEFKSISGRILSEWRREGKRIIWHIELPCNTAAEVILPEEWHICNSPELTRILQEKGDGLSKDFENQSVAEAQSITGDRLAFCNPLSSEDCSSRDRLPARYGLRISSDGTIRAGAGEYEIHLEHIRSGHPL